MRVAAVVSRGLLSLGVVMLASCSVFLDHEFDKLSPSEQESHFGTQAGFHRLFGVPVLAREDQLKSQFGRNKGFEHRRNDRIRQETALDFR